MIDVRKGRPRDQRIDDEISGSALALLSEVGFERFSVEEVAARAGVAKTTVYRRFPTRNDLLAGALARLNDDLPEPPAQASVHDRLVAVLTPIRLNKAGAGKGRMIHVALTQTCRDPELAKLIQQRVIEPRRAMLRSVLSDGIASGELRADLDLDATVPLLVGSMVYLGSADQRGGTGTTVDSVVATVLSGLATPAEV